MSSSSSVASTPSATPSSSSSASEEGTVVKVAAKDVQAVMFGGQFPPYSPEVRDGKLVGIRVGAVEAGSAAARLGAHEGDVIEALNGVSLDNWAAVSKAEASTRTGRRFVVGLRRDGQPLTLVLELEGSAP